MKQKQEGIARTGVRVRGLVLHYYTVSTIGIIIIYMRNKKLLCVWRRRRSRRGERNKNRTFKLYNIVEPTWCWRQQLIINADEKNWNSMNRLVRKPSSSFYPSNSPSLSLSLFLNDMEDMIKRSQLIPCNAHPIRRIAIPIGCRKRGKINASSLVFRHSAPRAL